MTKQQLIQKYTRLRDEILAIIEESSAKFRENSNNSTGELYHQRSILAQQKYNTVIEFIKDIQTL